LMQCLLWVNRCVFIELPRYRLFAMHPIATIFCGLAE
jgi:hypothetical protein